MIKDPEEYDRRMETLNKRSEDLLKEREARETKIKRMTEERNRYLYTPPPFLTQTR